MRGDFNLLRVNMKRVLIVISIVVLIAYMAVSALMLSRHGYLSGGYTLRGQVMERADSAITQAIDQGEFPGAVLCVVRRALDGESMGRILYLKAYGNRQVTSGRDASGEWMADTLPMTTDAVFDLASLSKSVGTTLAFMRLVENGQVRLTDNVAHYIPDFKPWESTPAKRGERIEREHITIKHLLTHTSGLPAGVNVPSFIKLYSEKGDIEQMNLRDSLVRYIATEAKRRTRPDEKMTYSCLNFVALQAIIENVTGQRLDHFLQREIYGPMQLTNTWYNAIDEQPPFTSDTPIVPTEVQADGDVLYGEVHDPTARILNRGVSGNAGLFSTAEDLAALASMIMNGGVIRIDKDGLQGRVGADERVRILSEAAVKKMMQIPAEYDEFGRTLGWDSGFFGDLATREHSINHTGYTGTSMSIDNERGVAVILLTSRVHPMDNGSLARTRAVVSNIVLSALDK